MVVGVTCACAASEGINGPQGIVWGHAGVTCWPMLGRDALL